MSLRFSPCSREKLVHVPAEMFHHRIRNFRRQYDVKTFFRDVPAHHPLGIGIEGWISWPEFPVRSNPLPTPTTTVAAAPSPKSMRGNQVRHRKVVALQRQRTQLDGKQRGRLIGKAANVIRRARNSRGARHAAKSENRNALDVRRESHAIDEPRIERRRRDTGHRRHKNRAQIARFNARADQRAAQSFLAQFQARLRSRRRSPRPTSSSHLVKIQRPHSEPAVDLHALVEAVENVGLRQTVLPIRSSARLPEVPACGNTSGNALPTPAILINAAPRASARAEGIKLIKRTSRQFHPKRLNLAQ